MNREAVDTALGLAGNMPLTDDDKQYHNLVYVFCKNLYLPTLFTSLCEIDWRCARKEELVHPTQRFTVPNGMFYYDLPADCIRPLYVDDNDADFKNDSDFIVTQRPVTRLYYVFHRRSIAGLLLRAPETEEEIGNSVYVRPPDNDIDALNPRAYAALAEQPQGDNDEDFPEWEYTSYDTDFWTYFAYKLAAALVPKLRSDDGAASRAQALAALASQKGEEAIQRSKAAAVNPRGQYQSWAQKCGLSARPVR